MEGVSHRSLRLLNWFTGRLLTECKSNKENEAEMAKKISLANVPHAGQEPSALGAWSTGSAFNRVGPAGERHLPNMQISRVVASFLPWVNLPIQSCLGGFVILLLSSTCIFACLLSCTLVTCEENDRCAQIGGILIIQQRSQQQIPES